MIEQETVSGNSQSDSSDQDVSLVDDVSSDQVESRPIQQHAVGSDNGSDDSHQDKVQLFRKGSTDQRKFRCLIGSEIILEGTIGVGKSTLGRSLTEYLKGVGLPVRFYPEFRNDMLLKQYIGDMKKYAYSFQVIMARERLRIYREACEFSQNGGISIIDRSLIGDYTFALMQKEKEFISGDEWDIYLNLIQHDSDAEPFVTLYLQCSPEEAFARMKKRNIQAEISGYTLDYFEDLHDAYMVTIGSVDHPVYPIPWGDDREIDRDLLSDETCEEVLTFIRGIIIN